MSAQTVFDFVPNADIQNWTIVDDVVMGGVSSGRFDLSPEGLGIFSGTVSLENNGGFSSVRYRFPSVNVLPAEKIVIRLKGDGKNYRLRVKNDERNFYSYSLPFSTSGQWEELEIPLNQMFPVFRGMKLDQPNFAHSSIEELAFLIGNKKPEQFELIIDKIFVRN